MTCPSQAAPEQQGRAPCFWRDRACGGGGHRQEAVEAISSPLGMEPRTLRWKRDSVPSLLMQPQLSRLARLPSASPTGSFCPSRSTTHPEPAPSRNNGTQDPAELRRECVSRPCGQMKLAVSRQACAVRIKGHPEHGLGVGAVLRQEWLWHSEPTLPPLVPCSSWGGREGQRAGSSPAGLLSAEGQPLRAWV